MDAFLGLFDPSKPAHPLPSPLPQAALPQLAMTQGYLQQLLLAQQFLPGPSLHPLPPPADSLLGLLCLLQGTPQPGLLGSAPLPLGLSLPPSTSTGTTSVQPEQPPLLQLQHSLQPLQPLPAATPEPSCSVTQQPESSDNQKGKKRRRGQTQEDDDEPFINVDFFDDRTHKEKRDANIDYYRRMKTLLKKQDALVCSSCSQSVERNAHAITEHVAGHADHAIVLVCHVCGLETEKRAVIWHHITSSHPTAERDKYHSKKDHDKLSLMLTECFPKAYRNRPKQVNSPARKGASASADDASENNKLEKTSVFARTALGKAMAELCKDSEGRLPCRSCGRAIHARPSTLQCHIRNLHPMFKCRTCSSVLSSEEEARCHVEREHSASDGLLLSHVTHTAVLDVMERRYNECFAPPGKEVHEERGEESRARKRSRDNAKP